MIDKPKFVLAGNGPYLNRGCEAIIRGTIEILRKSFDNPQIQTLSIFHNRDEFDRQISGEYDHGIEHGLMQPILKRKSPPWLVYRAMLACGIPYGSIYLRSNRKKIAEATAVLSIGGDNYSLDYGIPRMYTGLDDHVLKKDTPLIIWGASVGPFSRLPDYEQYMRGHLKRVTAVFARESATVEYLDRLGVRDNVYLVADPAFLMKPCIASDIDIPERAIGLNFSPLMGRYVSGGNRSAWTRLASAIIEAVRDRLNMPVYLIPHVTQNHSNDYEFMREARSLLKDKSGTVLVGDRLNAREIKWLISRMKVFAGARTHATIAALSSGVPTLSFGYSMKAVGINRDVYGSDDYCMLPSDVSAGSIAERIEHLVSHCGEISNKISHRLPSILERAASAGEYLIRILKDARNQ